MINIGQHMIYKETREWKIDEIRGVPHQAYEPGVPMRWVVMVLKLKVKHDGWSSMAAQPISTNGRVDYESLG